MDPHEDSQSLQHQPQQGENSKLRSWLMIVSDCPDIDSTMNSVPWPAAEVPVEIFELITSYLYRSEVRTLRLVCREFEAKVSAQFFKNVVVPFRSELYGQLRDESSPSTKNPAASVFSNGMRIFEAFGPHILRFALSLELEEDDLAFPPVKPLQEAVPTFWGIYRWPHETYHRYTDLEGLEQTADETEGMKEALKYLIKVTNLGLCCDAGLGFLLGPDRGGHLPSRGHQSIFATGDWRRTHQNLDGGSSQATSPVLTVADLSDRARNAKDLPNPLWAKHKILEKMAADAGYSKWQTDEAVQVMLQTEGTTLAKVDFHERATHPRDQDRYNSLASFHALHPATDAEPFSDADHWPLIPASLSRAQRELLLELEWAHRAMIQSYVISIVDNASLGGYGNLTTLTIAKIPSCHVHILCREDLWMGVPSLKNIYLGVIADWRRVTKSAPGLIEDTSVSPVKAVGKVFELFQDYIGLQPQIESIHFEWICGGEFASGIYQRNQYILPAPFHSSPDLMVSPDTAIDDTKNLLRLPHIKHLSLKNCWAPPHIFLQTVRQMALASLEKLELESVSLTGPPSTSYQSALVPIGHANTMVHPTILGANTATHGGNAAPMDLMSLFTHNMNAALNPPTMLHQLPGNPMSQLNSLYAWSSGPTDALRQPEWLSWAGIIDHFAPGIKARNTVALQSENMSEIADMWTEKLEAVSSFLPKATDLPSDEMRYKLKCLSIKSCGYVIIDMPHIDTRAVTPPDVANYVSSIVRAAANSMAGIMQSCRDKLLGKISPFMPVAELRYLESGYGVTSGWDSIYDERTRAEAVSDGLDHAGHGRFSGVVEASGVHI